MSECDICGPVRPDLQLNKAMAGAKKLSNEKKETTIIYRDQLTGFGFCTEAVYFDSRPGQFYACVLSDSARDAVK